MSIKRAPREKSPFTIVNNGVFEAGNLSFPAMGFLCYLISKPDHWEISIPNCIQVTQGTRKPFGRDAIYALIDELISAGYIDRIDTRSADGRRTGVDYVVYDRPEGTRSKPVSSSVSDYQLPPEPEVVQPNPVEADYLVKTDSKKGLNTPIVPAERGDDMDAVWFAYPSWRRGSRKPVEASLRSAIKRGAKVTDILEGIRRAVAFWPKTSKEPRSNFIPNLTTFLNQARWTVTDEELEASWRPASAPRHQSASDLAEQHAIRMMQRMGMNR